MKHPLHVCGTAAALLLGLVGPVSGSEPSYSDENSRSPWLPQRWFIQGGTASEVRTLSLGLTWESSRHWEVIEGTRLNVLTEVSLGRWHAEGHPSGNTTNTQIGLTPTLRLTSQGRPGWFVEIGIGVNLIVPIYESNQRRFSTAFNFGDHIGVGLRPFGAKGPEFALRYQHFSNAGIKHPNPGENFVQLRWSQPF